MAYKRLKNAYELVNLGAFKCSLLNELHIFQCMGKISYPYIERCDFYTMLVI